MSGESSFLPIFQRGIKNYANKSTNIHNILPKIKEKIEIKLYILDDSYMTITTTVKKSYLNITDETGD